MRVDLNVAANLVVFIHNEIENLEKAKKWWKRELKV